jgi:hypothetical protein
VELAYNCQCNNKCNPYLELISCQAKTLMNENNFAAKRHQWAMLRSRRSFKLPFAKKTIFYLFAVCILGILNYYDSSSACML